MKRTLVVLTLAPAYAVLCAYLASAQDATSPAPQIYIPSAVSAQGGLSERTQLLGRENEQDRGGRADFGVPSCHLGSLQTGDSRRVKELAPPPAGDTSLTLPTPSGPHKIGTRSFSVADESRLDPIAQESGQFRQINLQVWYPGRIEGHHAIERYIPMPALLRVMKETEYLNLPANTIDKWAQVRTSASANVPIIDGPRQLPLVLFSHGFGMARCNYTSIIQDLASHGYIVIAVDHPYAGLTVLPDGRVLSVEQDSKNGDLKAGIRRVEDAAKDLMFVLDAVAKRHSAIGELAQRVDLSKVGVVGHSLGGAVALEACRTGGPFKVCVDMDGDPWGRVETEGVGRPYLIMLHQPQESHRPPPAMRKQRDEQWASIMSKRNTPAAVLVLEDSSHFSFSDLPFILSSELLEKHGATLLPARGFEIVTECLRAFLSSHLDPQKNVKLEAVADLYPEVELVD